MDKAPDAFRTISEVAVELDVPQHVLRFWESRFPQIKPMKRAGGRRYYRPDDVDLLRGIRHLLYGEGYTIKGVKGILSDPKKGPKFVQAVWQSGAAQSPAEQVDQGPEQSEQLLPDEAARTLFGLLKSPSRSRPSGDEETERAEPREPAAAPGGPHITHEDVRRLRSALHELGECRRLIEDALKDEAA